VWSGGNGGVTRLINESQLINMGPSNVSGYFRGPGRAPHNLYTSTDNIWLQTPEDQPGPPPAQLRYLEGEAEFGGEETSGVKARVGSEQIEWTWNPEFEKFDRSQRGRDHDDQVFGRIRATNVIVLGVEYKPSVVDRNSPEAQTIGEGPAYFFSNGEFIEGTWKREFSLFPIEYLGPDGEPVEFGVGNTWIELADIGDVLTGAVEVLPSAPPAP
jgi:hypothetical protein